MTYVFAGLVVFVEHHPAPIVNSVGHTSQRFVRVRYLKGPRFLVAFLGGER